MDFSFTHILKKIIPQIYSEFGSQFWINDLKIVK